MHIGQAPSPPRDNINPLRILLLIIALLSLWGCNGALKNGNDKTQGTGGLTDRERYRDVARYYPIDALTRKQLPARVSLEQWAPTPQHQGAQGSCVGWAAGFCARTILEAKRLDIDPDSIAFSPSYVFNQVRVEDCNSGSYLSDGLLLLQREGVLTLEEYPYRKTHCDVLPVDAERTKANKYRIEGFARLSSAERIDRVDIKAIQQHIAQGLPVVFVALISKAFKDLDGRLWEPDPASIDAAKAWREGIRNEEQVGGLSGHAMCIVGYDAFKYGGAFRIQNSWGTSFADQGRFWMRYDDLETFALEAYGMYPQSEARKDERTSAQAQVNIGLKTVPQSAYLPFYKLAADRFKLNRELPRGMKFKLELSNSRPLYLGILGRDGRGLPYAIYPEDSLQASFVGVAGTRDFRNAGCSMPMM